MADDAKLQIILEAVNQTASPFNDLVASLESLQKTAEEVAKSIGESVGSIAAAASQMDSGVSKDMEAAGRSVATFQKSASEELNAANKSFNDVRDNMEKGIKEVGGLVAIQMLGQSMEELGKKGEHLFDYAIEQGSDFQQSMQNIKTVIAANTDGTASWQDKLQGAGGMTDQLQQKALDLGSRGAQSANQIAEAMDTMLRAGVDAKTVLGGAAESAQNVSIVTGDKLDESANLVTEIYHQFREAFNSNGKSVQENMKTTGDVLTGTLLSARINSQDFLDTLKYVGPVASQLGSSFLDTATATALLAQNGIKGSQAGNNLKRALTSLLEPTKQGAAAMEKLGLIQHGHNMLIDQSTGKMKNLTDIQEILHKSMNGLTEAKKAQYIHDMFGQYALAGTLVLANENSEAFAKLKEHIGSVSAEQSAAAMLDTFSGHMAQLKAHVQTTAKEFGLAFIPALEKLVPIGQKILGWLQELTPANKEFLMGILGVGSALAVAGGALATFAISMKFAKEGMEAIKGLFMVQAEGEAAISIFKRFATTMREVGMAEAFAELMSPAVWIALAVAAVVALAVVIIQHWSQIKAFLQKSWEETKGIATEVWGAISKFFKDLWTTIESDAKSVWNPISNWFSNTWDTIKQKTTDTWNGITSWLSNAWNSIKSTTQTVWNGIINFFKQWGLDILGIITLPFGGISLIIYNHWDQIKTFTITLWNEITSSIQDIWNKFTSWISNAAQTAVNWVVNAFDWMFNHNYYFQNLVDFIMEKWNDISNFTMQIWNAVSQFLSSSWNEISSASVTIWTAVSSFFITTWNTIKTDANTAWNDFKTALNTIWTDISTTASTVWNAVTDFFSTVWTNIKTNASTLWEDIKTALNLEWQLIVQLFHTVWGPFSNLVSTVWNDIENGANYAWGVIKTTLNNLWNGVVSDGENIFNGLGTFFSNLWNEALNWGSNLVHMVGQGIRNAAGEVADAAKDVAGSIANFLGFHSPTKLGPASTSDRWAPAFVSMFAQGLKDGAPTISDAANTLIAPLSDTFQGLSPGVSFNSEKMGSTVQLIMNAKKAYADASLKHDQSAMDSAHKLADEYRKSLDAMGVNSKLFSQDTSVEDCMKNLQLISQQVTTKVSTDNQTMTTGLMANNTDLSANTQTSTTDMAQSWMDTRNKTVQVAMDLGNSLKAVLTFISANVTNMCTTAEQAFKDSFQSIADTCVTSMNRVVQAVNMARMAMASMGGGGSFGVAMAGPSYSGSSMAMSPIMAPVTYGGSTGNTYNVKVNASGNITQNEQALGNIVSKAIIDKMKFQGKIG